MPTKLAIQFGSFTDTSHKRFAQIDESMERPTQNSTCYKTGEFTLDRRQNFHFERLKPQNDGPMELAAMPTYSGDTAVTRDQEPERSKEKVLDDQLQPSYREEKFLSNASEVSLP